ncbi:MAG TPA: hydroxymethylbilane synthase [Syntrophales bacterium]|nr:hydroxymethylbilane synthase [Syntrophales bacterium]
MWPRSGACFIWRAEKDPSKGGRTIRNLIRIGTRGSQLALTQTNAVATEIRKRHPALTVEVQAIRTKGDIMQDVSLAKIGGKGLFVKEIEEALVRGEIDLAVHSMKDVPVELPAGLAIGIVTRREDPRDVLVSRDRLKLEALPEGARLGTGSLRRGFQLRNILPDVEIVSLRGNLDTRIRRVGTEGLDGVILAAAGIRRMGWVERVSQFIPVEVLLPAIGQGVLGIEHRSDDRELLEALAFLHDRETALAVTAERAFLADLGGGCQLPVAAYARLRGPELVLRGLVGSLDGRAMIRDEVRGAADDGATLGRRLASTILDRGGRAILETVYACGD